MEKKHWLKSKTLWINGLMVIAALASIFGFDLALDPGAQEAIAVGAIAVVNMILRLVTKQGINNG